MPSNSLPALTFATVVLLFTTIVVGGYVSQTGAGLACPDWPLCPLSLDAFVVVEFVHRILAITAFLVALATFIAARRTHSSVAPKKLITAGFILLIVQVFLIGSSVIYSSLEPILVTAHLGVAVTVLSLYVASYIQMRGNPKGKN
ncbi:MAG: COX15/CtaA family protein [Nitrososphaerota archaeon]